MELTRTNELRRGRRRYRGRWKLSSSDEVRYEAEGLGEEFSFSGVPVSAGPYELAVAATVKEEDQKTVTRLWKLRGAWRADAKNRLVFEVEKESGKNDSLVFGGEWKAGESQIVYSLRRKNAKDAPSFAQKFSLSGRWGLTETAGLQYFVGGDTEAGLRFRAAFQTRSVLAKKGEIRYQIGVEAAGRRRLRGVSVFGKWKVSRDLGIYFETGPGQDRASVFGGEYSLDSKDRISVELKTRGRPVGLEVVFTRDVFGDGELFARLSRTLEEKRVDAGVSWRW